MSSHECLVCIHDLEEATTSVVEVPKKYCCASCWKPRISGLSSLKRSFVFSNDVSLIWRTWRSYRHNEDRNPTGHHSSNCATRVIKWNGRLLYSTLLRCSSAPRSSSLYIWIVSKLYIIVSPTIFTLEFPFAPWHPFSTRTETTLTTNPNCRYWSGTQNQTEWLVVRVMAVKSSM